jgi:hypothetical protein
MTDSKLRTLKDIEKENAGLLGMNASHVLREEAKKVYEYHCMKGKTAKAKNIKWYHYGICDETKRFYNLEDG